MVFGVNIGAFDDEYEYEEQEGNGECQKTVGFGPIPGGRPLQPPEILAWLDGQDSTSIRRVMFHCRWLLEQRGEPLENVGFGEGGETGTVKQESDSTGGEATPNNDDTGETSKSGGNAQARYITKIITEKTNVDPTIESISSLLK